MATYLQNNLTTRLSGITVPDLGSRGTDFLRIEDVDPTFSNLNDGSAILYRMMTLFNSDTPSTQPDYHFFEDDVLPVSTTVNHSGGYSDSDTSIVVTDAVGVAGTPVVNPATGEIMLVKSIATDEGVQTWTVTRGYQGSTAADLDDGAEIVLLGSTLEEFGAAKGGITVLPPEISNYVSFFSQSVNSSDLQEATNMLNGVGQVGGEFGKVSTWLMRQMDFALRHSLGYVDTDFNGTSKTAYYTKGLESYVTTNANIPKVGASWDDFNEQFNASFNYTQSSPVKVLFCNQTLFSAINKVAWDRWEANPAFEETLGARIGTLKLDGGGLIDIILDRFGFTNTGTQGYLLDMNHCQLKAMAGHELQWREITLPSDHGVTHEIYGSTSMKVTQGSTLHRTVALANS